MGGRVETNESGEIKPVAIEAPVER